MLDLISEFSRITWYKIYTQKSLAFLYTNNEKSERETKESIVFTTATKRIKYLGINLPKETKEIKGIQIGKEKLKPSLFADDMILYIENPKVHIRKLLELISEFRKVQDTKSIHRNHLQFCILTMNNQKEKSRN